MENLKFKKEFLRLHMKQLRKGVLPSARKRAAEALVERFSQTSGPILSYASFGAELDTSFLNQRLAQKGALVLPLVSGAQLRLFCIDDLASQTARTLRCFCEPIPGRATEIAPSEIETALVPGLAFNRYGHRLGYGKGHYDRLLASFPLHSIGIGFNIQLLEDLPVESHDIALNQLYLF